MTTTTTTPCSEAITHLEWFKFGKQLSDICRIARDLAADDARVARGASGGRSSSDISDPTGDTAIAAAMADDARDVAGTMVGALATLEDSTLGCLAELGIDRRQTLTDLDGRLSDVIAHLHVLDANLVVALTDPGQYAAAIEVSDRIQVEIVGTAAWLHAKAEALWQAAPARHQVQAVQKPRHTCTSCARFGINQDPRPGRTLCRGCEDHKGEHGCLPTERTCRRWWNLSTWDVLPGEILQAKATAKGAPRGRRKRSA